MSQLFRQNMLNMKNRWEQDFVNSHARFFLVPPDDTVNKMVGTKLKNENTFAPWEFEQRPCQCPVQSPGMGTSLKADILTTSTDASH